MNERPFLVNVFGPHGAVVHLDRNPDPRTCGVSRSEFDPADHPPFSARIVHGPISHVWLQLVEGEEDLALEETADAQEGRIPDAIQFELDELGWEAFLGYSYGRMDESGYGWGFCRAWTDWGLQHGIAPYQPFCIRIEGIPKYSTDYWGETDVDMPEVVIERVIPRSPFETLRSWEHWFMIRARYREEAREAMRRLIDQRQHDVQSMYLRFSPYFGPKDCYYDEMSAPHGLSIKLCSRHTQVEVCFKSAWPDLVEGRDDDGDRDKAMARLLETARERLPHLSEETIRSLGRDVR